MNPHEREQLLELAEQIVLNLRGRLAGIDNLNFPEPDPGKSVQEACLLRDNEAPDSSKKDKPHDQV